MCQYGTGRSTSAYRVQTRQCFPHNRRPSTCGRTPLRLTSTISVGLDRLDDPPVGVVRIRCDKMSFLPLPLTLTDRLPAEIMEYILDGAKCDTRTLYACLLVCTAWHSFLIDSLYEPICLHDKPQLYALAHAVRRYPAVCHRIASARALILWSHQSHSSGFVDVFPLVLGPHLHNLEHLSFRGCIWHPLHASFFGMLHLLKGVKRLELSTSSPRNLADLQRIVCAFPQLEELYIEKFRSSSMKSSQPAPPHLLNLPCVLKLTSVRISQLPLYFFRDLVAWLSLSGVCGATQTLDISQTTGTAGRQGTVLMRSWRTLPRRYNTYTCPFQ